MNRNLYVRGLLLALFLGHTGVMADSPARMPAQIHPAYKAECGTCHTAYPPGMLPAASWQRIMKGLEQHYGTDASLEPAMVLQLGQWLETHAGQGRKMGTSPPEDRITRSAWFVKEHRDIEPGVWKLTSVKSPTNCAACHTNSDQGRFSEHDLKRPSGLTPNQARAWIDD